MFDLIAQVTNIKGHQEAYTNIIKISQLIHNRF